MSEHPPAAAVRKGLKKGPPIRKATIKTRGVGNKSDGGESNLYAFRADGRFGDDIHGWVTPICPA